MTIAVDLGRKATKQTNKPSQCNWKIVDWDVKNEIKQTKETTVVLHLKWNGQHDIGSNLNETVEQSLDPVRNCVMLHGNFFQSFQH